MSNLSLNYSLHPNLCGTFSFLVYPKKNVTFLIRNNLILKFPFTDSEMIYSQTNI